MKYSEARRILEKNGMKLDGRSGGNTYITHNGIAFMVIPKKHMYIANGLRDNTGADSHQLAIAQKVAYKLSRTKPEDREDKPKKYYLRILNFPDINDGYVNLDKRSNKYILSMSSDSDYYQTLFTDAEVKQMQQDPIFANIDLEKCKEEPMPF